jgi:hypothetical protein
MIPERRGDAVEGAVVEPELLGVSDLVLDLETRFGRAPAGRLDERRREVDARRVRPRSGEPLGDGARPAREVEPALTRLRADALDQGVVDVRDRVRHVLEGAASPHCALP